MKNLKSLFLALAVVAMPFAFTSCNPDDNGVATITFDGATNNAIEIVEGADFTITGTVRSEAGTTINSIVAHVLYGTGQATPILIADNSDRNDNTFAGSGNNFTFRFDETHRLADYLDRENLRLRITATVRGGDASERTLTINVKPDETPLSAAHAFTLAHPEATAGGNPREAFGIRWQQNLAYPNVRFDAQNIALTQAEFNSLNTAGTREALADFAEGKTFATTFEVRTGSNVGFFIIQDDETLRLVALTSLTLAAGTNRAHFTERH